MKKITLAFYSDPGHAWMKIPLSTIKKLNVADKISSYSYIRNSHAYLEEDCDAGIVIKALKENNVNIRIKEYNTNKTSKIRSYSSYNHNRIDWDSINGI